ncbi:complex I intermediate-associated protein 30-domain-containing protein [Thamnocephalis sphaerospora]|uniref:Complex I intermediate-associated protein 30-domain-containing protein n=1 Tax=Thamnocephalis sphaerospora TaxID=78915 RepID=A0A4P9XN93_9FUNG|nr:complex I intermediate-associated protein 30-domain-containing protein [Thamnocephalis sphaerospora]|eukprot:RKP07404.1 complex I intermediate-associated protein 30-domain-containing protein [Thamnocephalis sphaerospora]
MDAFERPVERVLQRLNTKEALSNWAVGCDKDIGGYSSASLDLTPEGTAKFHGTLSMRLPRQRKHIVRSGYAAMRCKGARPTLFGDVFWDTTPFRFLLLRVRGDHRRYMVNLQTDGVIETDLFQHRLFLRRPGEWEDVLIAFRDFTQTNNGLILPDQMQMLRERVRTVGVSLADGQEGSFQLEIDHIKMINTEDTDGDVDVHPALNQPRDPFVHHT